LTEFCRTELVAVENWGHVSQEFSTPQLSITPPTCGSWVPGGWPSFRQYKRTPHPWIRKKKDGWWKTLRLKMVSSLFRDVGKATGNHLPTFPKNMASQIRNWIGHIPRGKSLLREATLWIGKRPR